MTSRLRFSAAAQRDIAEAKEWYAEQPAPDLDLRFQLELEAVFRQIEALPESFAVVHRDIRRATLRRFPYGVFFHRRGDFWYVLAVVHHARHPRTWQRRRK